MNLQYIKIVTLSIQCVIYTVLLPSYSLCYSPELHTQFGLLQSWTLPAFPASSFLRWIAQLKLSGLRILRVVGETITVVFYWLVNLPNLQKLLSSLQIITSAAMHSQVYSTNYIYKLWIGVLRRRPAKSFCSCKWMQLPSLLQLLLLLQELPVRRWCNYMSHRVNVCVVWFKYWAHWTPWMTLTYKS